MASAPSVPTGLAATNVHSDGSLDLSWNPSTNAAALKTGAWTGCLWGWTGSLQDVLLMESTTMTGRAAGMFREVPVLELVKARMAPLNLDDQTMAGFGRSTNKLSDGTSTLFNGNVVNRIPYMNMTSSHQRWHRQRFAVGWHRAAPGRQHERLRGEQAPTTYGPRCKSVRLTSTATSSGCVRQR
jgi:hypothetical protein